jgi:hypothetical protein
VAARLGIDQRRVVRLVQNLTEAGLVPSGYRRRDLSNRELARLMIAAVADNGLHYAAPTVTTFSALESTAGLHRRCEDGIRPAPTLPRPRS